MIHSQLVSRRWAAIVGHWEFTNGQANYLGPEAEPPIAFGIALTDKRLEEGVVRARITLPEDADSARILLGYQSPESRYITIGLGGYNRAYVISEFIPGFGWRGITMAGSRSNLESDRAYSVEVRVLGQRLSLEVDGVRVIDHVLREPLSGDQVGLYSWGTQPVSFSDVEVLSESPKAFVVMQFSEPYNELYEDVIIPVADKMGLLTYRVSEVYGPGIILQDIIQGIAEARVIIAEITPPNPNVFYELGYAHALKKPTILLAERGKTLPFDISGYRVIFYENSIRGKNHVEDNLKKHLAAILKD